MAKHEQKILTAIAWCLAWGEQREPQFDMTVLQQMRQALSIGELDEVPESVRLLVQQVQQLQTIPEDYFPKTLTQLQQDYSDLWNQSIQIGLVYGGATKIKQYVFEAAKLPDIRGASALLDRINLIDLPAFFRCENGSNFPQSQKRLLYCQRVREDWLDQEFPGLSDALIPELVLYSTGGNILAFCPVAYVDNLADAIEKRYTHETLTANSCAVGDTFRLLELRFGRLQEIIEQTFWLEDYQQNLEHPLIREYFVQPDTEPEQAFKNRKNFNELAGHLAALFNKRRNGNGVGVNRSKRCYPPIFETHPYLKRDESDRRSAVAQAKSVPGNPAKGLPGDPWFSEASARKRLVGQIAKRDDISQQWYQDAGLDWQPGEAIDSWVNKFEQFLYQTPQRYYGKLRSETLTHCDVEEARSVREIGDASTPKGFIAYIYADGNNMGGYIQKKIKTPEDYQRFSRDIFEATEKSVYVALTEHLQPHRYKPDATSGRRSKREIWIHPFEILTIGGDDVLLVVPADKALAIAQTIGKEFENILKRRGYTTDKSYTPADIHRYKGEKLPSGTDQCELSMSIGVLITAEDTPIYYAEDLTSQLLKSAKKRAKELKNKEKAKNLETKTQEKDHYYGGTVDFLVMKSVTMISSNIAEFRSQGLTQTKPGQPKLKLYGAPYTLYELGGLLKTVQAFKDVNFPRSQLYQIRGFLEQGKRTAMLNYRYFRVRLLDEKAQNSLIQKFERAWCCPKDSENTGNLAPWMTLQEENEGSEPYKMTYETIWRELVDLYPFTAKSDADIPLHQEQSEEVRS